jgi:tetratricopeptide (TPR) repeat protein
MLFPIIAFAIAALALAAILWIILKHWKDLRLLNPRSIKEEVEREKREDMIRQRFERLSHDRIQPLKRLSRYVGKAVKESYHNAYERVRTLEKVYHTMTKPLANLHPTGRDRIKILLSEARSLMRDLKWADAERRFLEILASDPHHPDAYKGLGQIYLKQKLYPQAKETFEFLVRMKEADDAVYAGLADIAAAEGDKTTTEAMRLKAIEIRPKQANRHAELAEFYLSHTQPEKAWPAAKQASDLEPKSLKYLELCLETALLAGEHKEAKKRYDRLRLTLEDRNKLQVWKEKVEAMAER